MTGLTDLDATEAAAAIKRGELSSEALVRACLERIASLEPRIHASLCTTVSTEYAIGPAGPTTHPHDASRTPGGSSSGAAAAVAARMRPHALGSQTVGSIVRRATYLRLFGNESQVILAAASRSA